MQYIKLSANKLVMVDDDDYEWLSGWKWWFDGYYACREENNKKVYMHRQIMGFPAQRTDHKDRNRLNCQRNNLRPVSARVNALNRNVMPNNTSGHTGLIWCKDGRWKAEVHYKGKTICRYSKDKTKAIQINKELRKKYYGVLA